ncbi:MAG: tryptophan synthase subunit alpha [Thermoleophilia bacterium]|nr:tryptophan synthase subunit alpha [Thermoleophilia bacterium]
MSRLTDLFRKSKRPLLIPYMTGGYPSFRGCGELLAAFVEAGADIVELGIPFSDPLADGPVIQAASTAALGAGTRPRDVLRLALEVSEAGCPVILLSYLNTILAYGIEEFFADAAQSGVMGVVVPDLPAEEADLLSGAAKGEGIDVVLLAAPTSTEARLKQIAASASGFIYCVSTTGVTGARRILRADLPDFLARLRKFTDLPLAVGFGVSSVEQVRAVGAISDGVIIGSALVQMVAKAGNLADAKREIGAFLRAAGSELARLGSDPV